VCRALFRKEFCSELALSLSLSIACREAQGRNVRSDW
jgi:hypothetical protein